jgi:hypothetical protein
MPHLYIATVSEQGTGQQQIHHHPRRQTANPGLHGTGLGQRRINHLERDELGQLTQMTRREHTSGYRHRPGNDTLIQQRGSRPEHR